MRANISMKVCDMQFYAAYCLSLEGMEYKSITFRRRKKCFDVALVKKNLNAITFSFKEEGIEQTSYGKKELNELCITDLVCIAIELLTKVNSTDKVDKYVNLNGPKTVGYKVEMLYEDKVYTHYIKPHYNDSVWHAANKKLLGKCINQENIKEFMITNPNTKIKDMKMHQEYHLIADCQHTNDLLTFKRVSIDTFQVSISGGEFTEPVSFGFKLAVIPILNMLEWDEQKFERYEELTLAELSEVEFELYDIVMQLTIPDEYTGLVSYDMSELKELR